MAGGKVELADAGRTAQALWYEAPGRAVLRASALRAPGPGEALVRTLFSGVSRGTERLVFTGRVPPSEFASMRAPLQEGEFPYPVKYGYCAVGIIEEGPAELVGRPAFALHPHQTAFVAPLGLVNPLPEGLPPARAILAANMETALNALWDSGAGPGDRILVVGAGIVGLLTAALCARLPGAEVTLVDVESARAGLAASLGATFLRPQDWDGRADFDVAFHASASAPGLGLCVNALGLEGKIIEMSWHGAGETPVPLGGAFHSRRLQLVSTQVGQVAPSRRPRWSYGRRIAKAMELLRDPVFDALIDVEIAFADFPQEAARVFAPGAPGLGVRLRYEAASSS
jgi:threonine dehydrogenase-like Zn-dependent dehydrogenase